MPNETDVKNDGGSGNGDAAAAAAAKAAADKAAADVAAAGGGGEDITIKKSELEKIKSDRDNYRASLLVKKADERSLDKKDGAGDGGDKGGGATIDETKVKEIVKSESAAVLSEIYKSNESRAKRAFLKKYGEYVDDTQWVELLSSFNPRRGKATTEDILDDLEDAVLIHKRSTGKLEEHFKSEQERARREGRIEGQLDSGRDLGGAGDRNEGKSTGALTPKGEEMARGMHVDPAKASKVDPTKDNVIQI